MRGSWNLFTIHWFFPILDVLSGVCSIQIPQSYVPETDQTKIAITEDSETVFVIIVALLDAELCRFFLSCLAWNTLYQYVGKKCSLFSCAVDCARPFDSSIVPVPYSGFIESPQPPLTNYSMNLKSNDERKPDSLFDLNLSDFLNLVPIAAHKNWCYI